MLNFLNRRKHHGHLRWKKSGSPYLPCSWIAQSTFHPYSHFQVEHLGTYACIWLGLDMVAWMVSTFESKELRDVDLRDGMDIGMPSIKVYYLLNTFFAMCPSMVFRCFNTSSQCKNAFSISFYLNCPSSISYWSHVGCPSWNLLLK